MDKKKKIIPLIVIGAIVLLIIVIKLFSLIEVYLSSSYSRYKKKINELGYTEYESDIRLCSIYDCFKKDNIIVGLAKDNSELKFIVDNQAKYDKEALEFIKSLTGDDRILKLETPIKKFINGYDYNKTTDISYDFDDYYFGMGFEYDDFVYSLNSNNYNKGLYRFNPHSLSYYGKDDMELVSDLILDSIFVYDDNQFKMYEEFIREKIDDYVIDEINYFGLELFNQDNSINIISEKSYSDTSRIHIMIDSGYSFGYIKETYSADFFKDEYKDIVRYDIEYINKVKKLSIDVNKVLDYVKNALKEETKSYEDDSVEISVYRLEKSSKYAIKYDFKND